MKNIFKKIADPLIDWCFPPQCLVCGKVALLNGYLCHDCFYDLEIFGKAPHSFDPENSIIDEVSSLYKFNNVMKILIHNLKYNGCDYIGKFIGKQMGIYYKNTSFKNYDYLVPIPLHRIKKDMRTYNQAEEIANGISQISEIPINIGLLKRSIFTETQTKLNQEGRKENIKNAFKVIEKKEIPSSVILIDDVFTTGATTTEAAKMLKKAGVKKVGVLTASTPFFLRHLEFVFEMDDSDEINNEL